MVSVGVFGAFIAGVFSLLSPCSALLLPAFFAYAFSSKRQLVARTLAFFLGLSAVMVPLGIGVGWFGQLLMSHRSTLILVGGLAMVLFGLISFFGRGFNIPLLSRLNNRVRGTSWLAVFALGAVYGFAGFCAGPLLGAVLTTAMLSTSSLYGGLIMAMYALGMTVPLFFLAWAWDSRQLGDARWLRGRDVKFLGLTLNTISMASGVFFILIGLLFIKTEGLTGMPALMSVDKQLEAQQWAHGLMAGNELPLLLGALVIALVVAVWKYVRSTRD
ncbi:Cytochrome C biogenesis protein transmembrane region [Corynebacterium kalinowskii]|uniref:Cytochrome C biogenesis protein transmembrane region n=1 Tax=Corynebacterium kalinowskii TaxID=2675216 RepID=A0A6B8VS97_9CORY|nr:cytochrome c biogenesis CcdA family protein [Corynebacterium kalinowskii]QGU01616.1 Cytochrome C biogenesis protein transmembrane region [Corynebacterium kalinowskii]